MNHQVKLLIANTHRINIIENGNVQTEVDWNGHPWQNEKYSHTVTVMRTNLHMATY